MHPFTLLFLVAVILATLLEWWLIQRQLRQVARHRAQVPKAFAEHIELDAHQKAADYTQAKGRMGRWSLLYSTALLLIWTLGGGLALLDELWRGLEWGAVWTGVAVIFSLMLIGGLLDLPFSLYRTFRLEARFGFNRTTPKLFVLDTLKGMLVGLLIGTPLLWVVLWLMDSSGSLWWLYVWLVWFGFSLVMMWAYPTLIAPLFNKFEPLEQGPMRERIEALLERCGFASNGIFVMDGSKRSSHGNAYFTGLGNQKRIVFFDTLLEGLEIDEVEAVLAHELGHFRRKHIPKRLALMGGMSLAGLALLGWLSQQLWFYQSLGVPQPSIYMALILFMLVAPLFTLYLSPILNHLSRKHEFEADAFAVAQSSNTALISALVKLYRDNASTLTPDPLYSKFHDSHPPAPVRVAHLEAQAG